jgi:hypothetical protein
VASFQGVFPPKHERGPSPGPAPFNTRDTGSARL